MTDDATPAARHAAATDIALVGTGAALVAVCSLLAIPVGSAGVPITLQTFGVLLVGAVLGARRGAFAVLLYLLVGFAGLPVFAEGVGGLATFGRPSIGYLLAFPIAAWVTGAVTHRGSRRWTAHLVRLVLAVIAATLVVYAIGVPVLALRIGVGLPEALAINAAYVPFDAIKAVVVVIVAGAVHRAYPDLVRS
ncbi:biotin transporter BioY [Isoptericola sp. b490]|uniref:biotin transporter BioY n=1 Tax=Actinotalea lenta TaxID=3064654 RepID=UPI0027123421|nr:biotin transporter BioY [Isoptericola sp. b490]MDO8120836.1 biotin transporter BioY [Isoptericola sp. b490]